MKSALIEDLTPCFQDRCWMVVLLAREADVGVLLRRGPTEWWRVTLWDTKRDRFEGGQWFRGRIYPEKCDLSPDGKLLLYFAGKFGGRCAAGGYGYVWTAVSRPPYLTALALWPSDSTYGGGGVFFDNRTISCMGTHHPDHPPGPLRQVSGTSLRKGEVPVPCWLNGWYGIPAPNATTRIVELRKASGDLVLGREVPPDYAGPSRRRNLYTMYNASGEPLALFEAHWADWDLHGRLVAAAGGRILTGKLNRRRELVWKQLAAMGDDRPIRMEAPDWAQHW